MRRTPPKRRTARIRPLSAKREAVRDEHAAFVARILRERPWCERDGCRDIFSKAGMPRPSSDVHHRLMRSGGGGDSDTNVMAVCRPCHQRIHASPAVSYEAGWLVHSWDR